MHFLSLYEDMSLSMEKMEISQLQYLSITMELTVMNIISSLRLYILKKISRQGQNGGKSTLNKKYILKYSIIALLRSTGKQITAEINSVS